MSLEGVEYVEEALPLEGPPQRGGLEEDQDIIEEIEEIDPPKALGDVLESIAGALFLDSDMSLEIVWLKFFPFFRPLIGQYVSLTCTPCLVHL